MTTPRPLRYSAFDGSMVINAVNMRCPAWVIPRYHTLWLGADRRGTDLPVLNVPGYRAIAPLITETRHDLDLIVSGYHTQAGVVNADPWNGLAVNLAYLRANVIDIPANATGTYASVLTPPGMAARNVNLRVLPLVIKEDPDLPIKVYTFTVEIPAGQFA